MTYDTQHMLDDIAVTTQNRNVNEPYFEGAILRHMVKFIESPTHGSYEDMMLSLKSHPNYRN